MAEEPAFSVDFNEIAGTRREKRTRTGFTAAMQVECAWADRLTLQREFVGGVREQAGQPVYYLPAQYPDEADARCISCDLVEGVIEPEPDATDARYMQFEKCALQVQYAITTAGLNTGDEYDIDDAIDSSTEFLTLPPDNLWWTEADVLLDSDSAGAKQIKTIDWTRTISGVTTLPLVLFSHAGGVNQAAITCPAPGASALVFPIETLLYDGPRCRQSFNQDGDLQWEVELRFGYRNLGDRRTPRGTDPATVGGWNHAYRPGYTSPERVYTSSAANEIYRQYPVVDLAALIATF